MINPNLRAKDRIYSELPENLKTLMKNIYYQKMNTI